jgi:Asp-tRNA(Asn)/Glu-tRNA(Gln) amidotransferase B subunit
MNAAIRQEIGLYEISIRAAEKARDQIKKTIDTIERAGISSESARWRATEDLLRVTDSLNTAIHNLEHNIWQAQSLDEQIEREKIQRVFNEVVTNNPNMA